MYALCAVVQGLNGEYNEKYIDHSVEHGCSWETAWGSC